MSQRMGKMNGFPIRNDVYEDGKVVSTMTLASVEETDLGDDAFAPPKGYKEQKIDMPMMGPMGH
jgi:hypothetical protein